MYLIRFPFRNKKHKNLHLLSETLSVECSNVNYIKSIHKKICKLV